MTDVPPVETPLEVEPSESSVLPFVQPEDPNRAPIGPFVEQLAQFLVRYRTWRIYANNSRLQRSADLPDVEAAGALHERLFAKLLTSGVRYEAKRVETWVEVTLPFQESPNLLTLLATLETEFQLAECPPQSPAKPPLEWPENGHGA